MITLLKILFFSAVLFYGCVGINTGYAETYVTGNITTDTVWYKSNSPYIVTGTIQLFPGTTLTIEPAVTVKFNRSSGPENKYSIVIGGTLVARGTDYEPIIFTSNSADPSEGDWGQIRFVGGATNTHFDSQGNYISGSIIENCRIEYGYGVLSDSNANPFIHKCEFYKSRFVFSLYSNPAGGSVDFYLTENEFTDCVEVILQATNYWEVRVNFRSNELKNSHFSASGSVVNIIQNHFDGTVVIVGGHQYGGGNVLIDQNLIENNEKSGGAGGGISISSPGPHTLTITNNTIRNNKARIGGGIQCPYVNELYIENNTISGNIAQKYPNISPGGIGGGIHFPILGGALISIRDNTIKNNIAETGGGIYIEVSNDPCDVSIKNNDIVNNTQLDVVNGSKADIDATNNWWGTTDTETIGQHIFDFYDDITKGKVNYSPIALFPFSPPSAPTLSSPPNGATGVTIDPSFNWTTPEEGCSFHLQVSLSQNFSSTVIEQIDIPTKYCNLGGLLNNTTYYWRVKATRGGKNSDWSGTWSFTTIPLETISIPVQPSGVSNGAIAASYSYSTGGSNSNLGHDVEYRFDWGDGTYGAWSSSVSASKSWSNPGSYIIKAQARCATHTSVVSGWSRSLIVTISVETVSTPNAPNGSSSGVISKSNTYTTGGSTSSLGHSVEYQFDWKGDGDDLSAYGSATQSKTWTAAGAYDVRARARCSQDVSVVSGWSNSLSVNVSIPDISVTPKAYDFGNIKVKKSKTASFVLKNKGTANLSILSSTVTGIDASMFTVKSGSGSKTIKPGKTLTIKVAFKPRSAGTKSGILRITSNDPDTPTIDISLSGIGQ